MREPVHIHAKQLLITAEMILCSDASTSWPAFDELKRHSTRWWKFLKIGFDEVVRPLVKWAVGTLVLIAILRWLHATSQLDSPQIWSGLGLVVQVLPMIAIAFGLPSTYVDSGVPKDFISNLGSYLIEQGLDTTKKLEVLKKILTRYEDRARTRITSLKWLIGVTWGGANYFFSKALDSARNSPPAILELAIVAGALTFGTIFAYFVVSAYEAAVNRLFHGIEFGVSETILKLESDLAKPEQSV